MKYKQLCPKQKNLILKLRFNFLFVNNQSIGCGMNPVKVKLATVSNVAALI